MTLEAELERVRQVSTDDIASAIKSIGFECTRCGACCKAIDCETEEVEDLRDIREEIAPKRTDEHTATVFPDEIRHLQAAAEKAFDHSYDWRDVARPMPYGLRATASGDESHSGDQFIGETFEWALAVDDCGNCTFYEEDDGTGRCSVHVDRPLVCRTYPFSLVVSEDVELSSPLGNPVDREGPVRAHECNGLGREIDRPDAERLAEGLKERAIRELEEAIALLDRYEPADVGGVVVHDSEGPKRPDGTPLDR